MLRAHSQPGSGENMTNSFEDRAKTVGHQAPAGAWTPDELLLALRDRTDEDRVEALKLAGIIDADGNPTKAYKDWGDKVTRTLSYK